MIKQNRVSSEEKIFRQDNAATVRRVNRCTGRRPQVCARMRRSRFFVEDPSMAEVRALASGNRNTEWLVPEHFIGDRRMGGVPFLPLRGCRAQVRPTALSSRA